jgi:hypothetical protein
MPASADPTPTRTAGLEARRLRRGQRFIVSADGQRRRPRRVHARHCLRASVESPAQAGAHISVLTVGCDETVRRWLGQFLDAFGVRAPLSRDDPEAARILQPPVARSRILQPTAALLREGGAERRGQRQSDNHRHFYETAPRPRPGIQIGEHVACKGFRQRNFMNSCS